MKNGSSALVNLFCGCINSLLFEPFGGKPYPFGNGNGHRFYRFVRFINGHIRNGKTVLTFAENVTFEMTSVVRNDTRAWLFDENGEELVENDDDGYDWGNFSITYSFEAGKTYKLKVGFYSGDTSKGPILILFTEKNVTVIL